MQKAKEKNKEQLIEWFSQMREVEKSAKDMYFGIAEDSEVADDETKKSFREIAQEEERHAQMVQKIINIISSSL